MWARLSAMCGCDYCDSGSRAPRVTLQRVRRRAALLVSLVSVGVAACAPLVEMAPPSRSGPHISDLEFEPARTRAGCAVVLQFHVDSGRGPVSVATVGWVQTQRGKRTDSGYWVLPVEPMPISADHRAMLLRARVTPETPAVYLYYVQAEDEAGRKSNVLTGAIVVDAAWPWETATCS